MAETVERAGFNVVPGMPYKLSWGAIFGGTFVALGIWILLYSLGLALGLSSMDPSDPGSARSAGLLTGIWSLITPLIALFLGGLVAARTAGVVDKVGGALHGAVLWGFTTMAGAIVLGMVLSSLLGAAFNVGRSAMGALTGGPGQGGLAGQAAQQFGLDANDALAPVNQRLQQEGLPPVTPEQLQAATKDVLNTAIQQGRLDRELLVSSIAENTALSRQDANEVAGRIETQFNAARTQVGQQALQAADVSGRVFWGIFAALLLGLVSAVLGATLGVSKRQRVRASGEVVPPMGRREVYP